MNAADPISPNPSSPDSFLTAVAVLDTLIRSGMREAVLAPGSRSAPLAYALAAADDAGALRVHVRIDERTAGFTALGLAKTTGRPVGVVTTSGTAVGELMPAVMEAHLAEVPLAVLSADRPPRLRGTGANQTTWQPDLFGVHANAAVDLVSYPEEEPGEQTAGFNACLAALTGRSAERWEEPSGLPLGPVQINCAFDTPLAPDARTREILRAWAESVAGLEIPPAPRRVDTTVPVGLHPVSREEPGIEDGADGPEDARAVVLAGDGAGELARRFAEAHGLPLLAEPSSGARAGEHAIPAYRLLLEGPLGARIRRVLLFGRPTLTRPVGKLLAREDVETAVYRPRPVAWAEPSRRRETPLATLADAAAFVGVSGPRWLEQWQRDGARAVAEVEALLAADRTPDRSQDGDALTGPEAARRVWRAGARDGAALVCGSSNLIRDLDLLADAQSENPAQSGNHAQSENAAEDHEPSSGPRPFRVLANRGLAGIDGTLATASGVSLAGTGDEPDPVRVLVGDLTFLHDVGSLLIPRGEIVPNLQVVVFNDAGGGIFQTIEHGRLGGEPGWGSAVERMFGTPHDARIEPLVRGYGHDYALVRSTGELDAALAAPVRGIRVIEVCGTREHLVGTTERINAVTGAETENQNQAGIRPETEEHHTA